MDVKCPVDGCKNTASAASENRFCEYIDSWSVCARLAAIVFSSRCYKEFLSVLVWRHQIEPWYEFHILVTCGHRHSCCRTLYGDNQLRLKLVNLAAVTAPETAGSEDLVAVGLNIDRNLCVIEFLCSVGERTPEDFSGNANDDIKTIISRCYVVAFNLSSS